MSDCLFCKMIRGEIKAKVERDDQDLFAIHDIRPQAPHHVLVIPKKHIATLHEMQAQDQELLGKVIYGARQIAEKNGWEHYRLVFNNGAGAGQSVFHIHLHLLAGRSMSWPPG